MTAYEFVAKVFVLVSCLDPRLSLPEISSFQGNSKFFFLNIPIYARARISRSRLVTVDLSQARAPRALPTAQSPLFFFPFFAVHYRAARVYGRRGKKCGSRRRLEQFTIFFRVLYTKEFVPKFKRDFFRD